jgi:hypothetical protein
VIPIKTLFYITEYIQLFYFKDLFDLAELKELQEHFITGEDKMARVMFRKTFQL